MFKCLRFEGAATRVELGGAPLRSRVRLRKSVVHVDRPPSRHPRIAAAATPYSPPAAAARRGRRGPRRSTEALADDVAKLAAARRFTSDTTPIEPRGLAERAAGAAAAASHCAAQRAQLNEILRRAQHFESEAEGRHDIFEQPHVADFVHALLVAGAPLALQQQMRTELSQRALCADDVEQAIPNARQWQKIVHGVARPPSTGGTTTPELEAPRERLLRAAIRNGVVFHALAQHMRSAAPDSEEVLLTMALPQEFEHEEEPKTAKKRKKKKKKKKKTGEGETQKRTKTPASTAWIFPGLGRSAAALVVCVSSLIILAMFASSLIDTRPTETMTSRCTAAAGATLAQNDSATTFVTAATRSTLTPHILGVGTPTSRADDFVGGLGAASSGAVKKDGAPLYSTAIVVPSSDTVAAWASPFPVRFDAPERTSAQMDDAEPPGKCAVYETDTPRALYAFEEVRSTIACSCARLTDSYGCALQNRSANDSRSIARSLSSTPCLSPLASPLVICRWCGRTLVPQEIHSPRSHRSIRRRRFDAIAKSRAGLTGTSSQRCVACATNPYCASDPRSFLSRREPEPVEEPPYTVIEAHPCVASSLCVLQSQIPPCDTNARASHRAQARSSNEELAPVRFAQRPADCRGAAVVHVTRAFVQNCSTHADSSLSQRRTVHMPRAALADHRRRRCWEHHAGPHRCGAV